MCAVNGIDAQLVRWNQDKYSWPGVIKGDNHRAIALTKNIKDHGKVKHIDIWHHYIHNLIWSGDIPLEQVPSLENLTDFFTKPLPCDHHHLTLTLNLSQHPVNPLLSMGEYWTIPRISFANWLTLFGMITFDILFIYICIFISHSSFYSFIYIHIYLPPT